MYLDAFYCKSFDDSKAEPDNSHISLMELGNSQMDHSNKLTLWLQTLKLQTWVITGQIYTHRTSIWPFIQREIRSEQEDTGDFLSYCHDKKCSPDKCYQAASQSLGRVFFLVPALTGVKNVHHLLKSMNLRERLLKNTCIHLSKNYYAKPSVSASQYLFHINIPNTVYSLSHMSRLSDLID